MLTVIVLLLWLQDSNESMTPGSIFSKLEGLNDIARFINERDRRIDAELKQKYEQIQRSGVPVEGLTVKNGYLEVDGNPHPQFIKIQDPLSLLWDDFRDEDIYTVRELNARGLPAIDLKNLSEAFREEIDHRSYFNSRFHSEKKGKILTEMSEPEIRARIVAEQNLRKEIQRDWAVEVLSALSNQGRRIVVSYIFEVFVPYMRRSYFVEPSEEWIAAFKARALERTAPK